MTKSRRVRFDVLLSEMRRRNPQEREDAFSILRTHAAEFVDELQTTFEVERDHDHGLACWLLELLGDSKSPRAVPLLASLLTDADESYRWWAESGLQEIGTKEARTVLFNHRQRVFKHEA